MLLIGYGNPGRGDDGLGPAFAEHFEKLEIPGLVVDIDYQLTVEDATTVAQHAVVVFVDADLNGPEPFWIREIEPETDPGVHSHSVSPEAVMGFARALLKAEVTGYLIGIRGYAFEHFDERLSPPARQNLSAALKFFEPIFRSGVFKEAARVYPGRGKIGKPQEPT